MAEIIVDSITYTDEPLTCYHVGDGIYLAEWRGKYSARGAGRDFAIRNLAIFMQDAHPDIWHFEVKQAIDSYFAPKKNT